MAKKQSSQQLNQVMKFPTSSDETFEFANFKVTEQDKQQLQKQLLSQIILLILNDERQTQQILDTPYDNPLSVYIVQIATNQQGRLQKSQQEMLDLVKFLTDYENDLERLEYLIGSLYKGGVKSLDYLLNEVDGPVLANFKGSSSLIQFINQHKTSPKYRKQQILEQSKFLYKSDGLSIYLYPRYKKHEIQNLQEYKTMIVIGQTGSGKSTMINFFINYYLGIEFEDNFRFLLIQEETIGGNQAVSQTQDVNIYYIKPINGNPGLRIIDTPGFGDTRGIAQDKIIAEKIQKCFKNDVETVTTICFIVQSSNARLTGSQNYILSSITQMFGKDIIENFIFMFTFCDAGQPQAKNALLFKGDSQNQGSHVANLIPQIKEPWFLKLNSSAFLSPNRGEEQEIFMSKMFWNIGMASFKIYVEQKVKLNREASLRLTREVIKERETIMNVINNLRPKIQICLNLIENHKQTYVVIGQLESQMVDTQNFRIDTKKYRIEKQNLKQGEYVTNCVTCNITCHYPCTIPDDKDKARCAAIKNEVCTVCTRKCHWSNHANMPFRFVTIEYMEKTELKELKEKYLQSQSTKSQKEQILDGIENEYVKLQAECLVMQDQLMQCVNTLNQIALQPAVCKSQEEYVDLMIQEEMNSKKAGFQDRIQALTDLKENWKFIRETTENKGAVQLTQSFFQEKIKSQIVKKGKQGFFDKLRQYF